MATQKIEGQLEIDGDRGVIYFHSNEGYTALRIGKLPQGIPRVTPTLALDIAHMYGCSWRGVNGFPIHAADRTMEAQQREAREGLVTDRECFICKGKGQIPIFDFNGHETLGCCPTCDGTARIPKASDHIGSETRKCDRCGKIRECMFGHCPYDEELWPERVKEGDEQWRCAECIQHLCDEI